MNLYTYNILGKGEVPYTPPYELLVVEEKKRKAILKLASKKLKKIDQLMQNINYAKTKNQDREAFEALIRLEFAKTNKINYRPSGAVASAFINSVERIKIIMGPVGTGKTVLCIHELLQRMERAPVTIDGFRTSKIVVVRRTYPELMTAAIPSFMTWIREQKTQKRIVRYVKKPLPRCEILDHEKKIKCLIEFRASQRPEDFAKFKGSEYTVVYLNEMGEREVDGLLDITERVGREPSKGVMMNPEQGMKDRDLISGVLMDANPPSKSHILYELAKGAKVYIHNHDGLLSHPSGATNDFNEERYIELYNKRDNRYIPYEIEDDCPFKKILKKTVFFHQPSGVSKWAENKENLGDDYYSSIVTTRKGQYESKVEGKFSDIERDGAVFSRSFTKDLHVLPKQEIANKIDRTKTLYIGADVGDSHTPACVLFQMIDGVFYIHKEIIRFRTGVFMPNSVFFEKVIEATKELGFNHRDCIVYSDPRADVRHMNSDKGESAIDIIKRKGFISKRQTINDLRPRLDSVIQVLDKRVGGESIIRISSGCAELIRQLDGGYSYQKAKTPEGGTVLVDKIAKTGRDDVVDALQYGIMGFGKGRHVDDVIRPKRRKRRRVIYNHYDQYGY